MSTASQYANPDEFIGHRVGAARKRIKSTEVLTGGVLTGVLILGYVLLFTIFDHWVIKDGFSAQARAVMLFAVLAASAWIAYRIIIRAWGKAIHPLYAARMLDDAEDSLNGALVSAVDFEGASTQPPERIQATIEKRAAIGLSTLNMEEAIDRRWLLRLSLTLFGLVVATSLYALFSPKSIDLLRPLTFASSTVATRTQILSVQPGNATIQAG